MIKTFSSQGWHLHGIAISDCGIGIAKYILTSEKRNTSALKYNALIRICLLSPLLQCPRTQILTGARLHGVMIVPCWLMLTAPALSESSNWWAASSSLYLLYVNPPLHSSVFIYHLQSFHSYFALAFSQSATLPPPFVDVLLKVHSISSVSSSEVSSASLRVMVIMTAP